MSKAGIEPAFPADAAAKRDRGQGPVEPVAPLMIKADVLAGVAGQFAPHQGAAMGTAVDKSLDRAGLVAIEDDRRLADLGRPKISGIGDFAVEAEKAPYRPVEDPLLLAAIDVGVVIEAVRHSAVIEVRPNRSCQHRHFRPKKRPERVRAARRDASARRKSRQRCGRRASETRLRPAAPARFCSTRRGELRRIRYSSRARRGTSLR